MIEGSDAALVLGSTLSVFPAAGLLEVVERRGLALVIVNAQPTAFDGSADVVVRADLQGVIEGLLDLT